MLPQQDGRTNKQTNKERQSYSAIGLWKAEMSKKYSWICFYKFQRNQRRRQSSSLKVFAEVIFATLSCSNFWKLACFYQIKVQKVFSNKLFPIFLIRFHQHRIIDYLSIINNIQGQDRLHNRRSNLPTAASGDALQEAGINEANEVLRKKQLLIIWI